MLAEAVIQLLESSMSRMTAEPDETPVRWTEDSWRLWSIWLLRTTWPEQSAPPLRLNHRQRAPSRKILPLKVQAVELEISMQGPTTKSVCRSLLVTLTLAARSRKMAPSAPLRTVLESSVTPRVEATWMPPPPAYLAEPQVSIRLPLA